jgi:dihydrofolate reductase
VFVVTHRPPAQQPAESPFRFVTGGVVEAIEQAKAAAGDRNVGVAAGEMARQALTAGLIDEVQLDLVPVLLGGGTRLFGDLDKPISLGAPRVVESNGVTHLYYAIDNATKH